MREPPNIPKDRLRACLRERYDLEAVTLEFLPRGHDYSAGVFRVTTEQGKAYLLKVSARPLYEPSCLVPRYLRDRGIAAVVAPIPTGTHVLWTALGGWTAIVYPFLDGDASLTGMTDEHWKQAGDTFSQIHGVRPPMEGFDSLRVETFDPTAYTRWIRDFEARHLHARPAGTEPERALRASWLAHQSTIHTVLSSLEALAPVLRSRGLPYVICHADLHAANLLRDLTGRVFVLDWDEVMLAPKERDFIFIREPHADAFWDGYGQQEVDWVALTYFRWERVAQDLIEEAQQVLFKEDAGQESKADAARSFELTFVPGRNIAAARAAAAHLPPDLRLPDAPGS